MPYTWKINGVELTTSRLEHLKLVFHNLAADECTFDDPFTLWDADLRFAFGTDIVVTYNAGAGDICIFRGAVAETPRFMGAKAESVQYKALGRWRDLERYPFVQQWKINTTPGGAPTLSDLPLGLVVLNQGDNGASALLGDSLKYVVSTAVAAGAPLALPLVGAVDPSLNFYVPWDEATDLNCADAIKRLLQLTPDVVVAWNYAVNPPQIRFYRRANLPAVNLPVAGPGAAGLGGGYAPLDNITLTPLYHLQASGVCIIYVRTDRTDGTPYLLTGQDAYPPGTVPGQRDCITRTVKLTGAVTNDNYLTQDVLTNPLPTAALADAAAMSAGFNTDHFGSADAFFKKHCPQLRAAGVTTKSYLNTYRTPVDGDTGDPGTSPAPNAACVRELLSGSVTDWMIADQDIVAEVENVHTDVAYSVITDPQTGATEYKWEKLCVKITATNASTQTYSELVNTGYTAPETAPAGLAEAIYNGVAQLHYDGTFDLVGYDPVVTVGIGNVVNLSNSRAEWAAMQALVQSVILDVDRGRTSVRVGWPRQLMPADLMQVWRANRTRRDVNDSNARATGVGGDGTGDQSQALGKHHHAPAAGTASHILPSTFTCLVTPAGAVPVVSDLTNALAAVPMGGTALYPTGTWLATQRVPKSGDQVKFYTAGNPPFLTGTVTCQDPRGPDATDSLFAFAFEANGGATWFMHCVQNGAYVPPA